MAIEAQTPPPGPPAARAQAGEGASQDREPGSQAEGDQDLRHGQGRARCEGSAPTTPAPAKRKHRRTDRPSPGRPEGVIEPFPRGSRPGIDVTLVARRRLEMGSLGGHGLADRGALAALEAVSGRIVDVLYERVSPFSAPHVLKSAAMIAESIAGKIPEQMQVESSVNIQLVSAYARPGARPAAFPLPAHPGQADQPSRLPAKGSGVGGVPGRAQSVPEAGPGGLAARAREPGGEGGRPGVAREGGPPSHFSQPQRDQSRSSGYPPSGAVPPSAYAPPPGASSNEDGSSVFFAPGEGVGPSGSESEATGAGETGFVQRPRKRSSWDVREPVQSLLARETVEVPQPVRVVPPKAPVVRKQGWEPVPPPHGVVRRAGSRADTMPAPEPVAPPAKKKRKTGKERPVMTPEAYLKALGRREQMLKELQAAAAPVLEGEQLSLVMGRGGWR